MKAGLCAVLASWVAVAPVQASTASQVTVPAVAKTAAGVKVASARFGVSTSDPQNISGDVRTLAGHAKFSFDGSLCILDDGYTLGITRLANNDAEMVLKITGTSPAGDSAQATFSINRKTAEVHSSNSDRLRAVFADSSAFHVLVEGVPVLAAQMIQTHTFTDVQCADTGCDSGDPSTTCDPFSDSSCAPGCDLDAYDPNCDVTVTADGRKIEPGTGKQIFLCAMSGLAYLGSAMVLVGACGIPEPAQPLVCTGSFLLFVSAGGMTVYNCTPAKP